MNVKITVLKKEFYREIAEAYLTEGGSAGPCPILETGLFFTDLTKRPSCRRASVPGPGFSFIRKSAVCRLNGFPENRMRNTGGGIRIKQ